MVDLAIASNALVLAGWGYHRSMSRRTRAPGSAGEDTSTPLPRTADPVPSRDAADVAAFPRALKVIAAVLAPTTVLTGLLFYFGRIYANRTYGYFGVDFTTLDLTASDYLTRSADGLIVPLLVVAGLGILALWFHQLVESLPAARGRTVARVLAPATGVGGAVLMILALVDLLGSPLFVAHPEVGGTLLVVGVLLVGYAVRLVRTLAPERPAPRPVLTAVAEWAVLILVVSVGAFSAIGNYAGELGQIRAQQIERSLTDYAPVTLYSQKKLGLTAPGVLEIPCSDGADYKVRYEGLALLLQSGNQYLLLPTSWTHDSGTAFLLPRDGLRLEFTPPGQPPHSGC